MLEAASTGDVNQVLQLLQCVPVDSTDEDGWTALHFSSWAGRAALVKALLNHSANVRARDKVASLISSDLSTVCRRRRFADPGMAIMEDWLVTLSLTRILLVLSEESPERCH